MADRRLEQALHDLEVTANNFAARIMRMAQVRAEYVRLIKEKSQSIRAAVEAGELTAEKGARLAHEARNLILETQRQRDFDLGRALAKQLKDKGLSLEQVIIRCMKKLGLEGRAFQSLDGNQQRAVLMEVIDSAGRSRPSVTAKIPNLRWAARGLWLATILIAIYNIGTAENPWWQTGREAATLGGGFAGGAAVGALAGVWAGPVGVAIGALVGGILGSLLADHVYVEVAGTSNKETREFVGRYTSVVKGVDEPGMARALARLELTNPPFVRAVFLSLDHDYNTDADDVALELVNIARGDGTLSRSLTKDVELRNLLIRLLDDGWTSAEEEVAIRFLSGLSTPQGRGSQAPAPASFIGDVGAELELLGNLEAFADYKKPSNPNDRGESKKSILVCNKGDRLRVISIEHRVATARADGKVYEIVKAAILRRSQRTGPPGVYYFWIVYKSVKKAAVVAPASQARKAPAKKSAGGQLRG